MNTEYLIFNSRDKFLRIKVSDIVYFESDGNYTGIVSANKLKSSVCMNLVHMERLLAEKLGDKRTMFVRVGKRFIINTSYLYMIVPARQRLVLSDMESFVYQLDMSKDALSKLKVLMVELVSKGNK